MRALDHFPMGSRLTPRAMSAAASSRRRVFSVLVRSVTGRRPSCACCRRSRRRPSCACGNEACMRAAMQAGMRAGFAA